MNGLDWVLGGIGAFCMARGIWRGAISQVFGILGVLGGFYLASHYYQNIARELSEAFPSLTGVQALSFILLFIQTWFCIGMIGYCFAKLVQKSGLGILDRLTGGFVGFIKAMVLSVAIISTLTIFLSPRNSILCGSTLAPLVQELAQWAVKATPAGVQSIFTDRRKQLERYWLEQRKLQPRQTPSGNEKRETENGHEPRHPMGQGWKDMGDHRSIAGKARVPLGP
jgi:membrane protein required for colicin V production